MITLDTNIIVYFLKREPVAVGAMTRLLETATILYVPTVVEVELFSLPTLSVQEALETDAFLETVVRIPLNSELARLAGELRGRYRLKLADSVIAATALFTHSTLLTRNTRDFKEISGLAMRGIYLSI